jgi:hypothetical protein
MLVHCVDTYSKELIYAWIVTMAPTVPAISKVFDLKCPADQAKNFTFGYSNRMNTEMVLMFVSSNPELLQLQETKVTFRAMERLQIKVRVQKRSDIPRSEVKVFVGDEEKSRDTYDCLLFRIQYHK